MPKQTLRVYYTAPETSIVFITGSFVNWQSKIKLTRNAPGSKLLYVDLTLTPGCFEYKFIVDGQWMCGEGPRSQDTRGNWNNVLVVDFGAKEVNLSAIFTMKQLTEKVAISGRAKAA